MQHHNARPLRAVWRGRLSLADLGDHKREAMHRSIILAVVAIFLASCSTTQQAAVALQNGWVGKNADDFFKRYGPPASNFALADGGIIYEWVGGRAAVYVPGTASTTTTTIGNTAFSNTQFSGGGNIYLGCKVRITTTRDRTITAIAPSGDSLGMWQTSRCAELFAG